jgi:hypothetical protein
LNDLVERLDGTMERLHEGLRDLRGEMTALRSEMRGEMVELRSEMRGEMSELRSEMRREMSELRRDGVLATAALVTAIVGTGVLT